MNESRNESMAFAYERMSKRSSELKTLDKSALQLFSQCDDSNCDDDTRI